VNSVSIAGRYLLARYLNNPPAPPAPQEHTMTIDTIEQEIQAKGLTAPRVTPGGVEAEIAGEYYASGAGAFSNNSMPVEHSLTLGVLTFCVLILRNGCKVVGINHGPVDPTGFDPEYGRKDAREDAIRQVWPLLGFRLRDQLASITGDFSAHDIADAHRDSFAAGQQQEAERA
jgi:hypothetical protein